MIGTHALAGEFHTSHQQPGERGWHRATARPRRAAQTAAFCWEKGN